LDALPALTDAEKSRAQQLSDIEGTVSIMFTDLEGSTELLNSLGDEENHEVIRRHNTMIREQISSHSGIEVKNMGDGFMVVFSSVRRAVTCAAEIQKSMGQYTEENPDRPLRVRIGINVGEAIKEEDDFFGTAVVLSARIMGKAIGGQILVSELFRRLAGTASGHKYSDHGWTQLKGFTEEEHLYEVDLWDSGG
jgi:class 3 adenylate cyclase